MVNALAPPENEASTVVPEWDTELLMPTIFKQMTFQERMRQWLWWGSLSTAYTNFLVYLANHR